jgi:hypothetical protein
MHEYSGKMISAPTTLSGREEGKVKSKRPHMNRPKELLAHAASAEEYMTDSVDIRRKNDGTFSRDASGRRSFWHFSWIHELQE